MVAVRSLLRNRMVVIGGGALIAAVTAYGVWSTWFAGGVRKGVGDFGYEFSSCQDEVFADLMEPADLVWAPGTEWHEGAPQQVHIGGTFTRVDLRTGKRRGFAYDCTARNRRIMNANVK